MAINKIINNYKGVIKNSIFEHSYHDNEFFDYTKVMNAGGVSSIQLDFSEDEEDSVIELYKLVYSS